MEVNQTEMASLLGISPGKLAATIEIEQWRRKSGRVVLYRRDDVLAWFTGQKQPSKKPHSDEVLQKCKTFGEHAEEKPTEECERCRWWKIDLANAEKLRDVALAEVEELRRELDLAARRQDALIKERDAARLQAAEQAGLAVTGGVQLLHAAQQSIARAHQQQVVVTTCEVVLNYAEFFEAARRERWPLLENPELAELRTRVAELETKLAAAEKPRQRQNWFLGRGRGEKKSPLPLQVYQSAFRHDPKLLGENKKVKELKNLYLGNTNGSS